MIYGAETWADGTDTWTVKKVHEKKLDMVEDGCVVTKPDKMRKEIIRGKAKCRKVVWVYMEKRRSICMGNGTFESEELPSNGN